MHVEWGESWNDTMYIFIWGLYWQLKITAWMGSNDAEWIQTDEQELVVHVHWSVGACHMHKHLQMLECYCVWMAIGQSKSIKLFRDSATGPNLSLTTDYMCLSHCLHFICSQWSGCMSVLTVSVASVDCRFLFHVQVMILTRFSYRLSSLASISVDGCCLYIIIHNSILHRIRL